MKCQHGGSIPDPARASATAGIFALWRLWIYAVAFLLLGLVLAPLWRRARVLTDAELAELRYGGRAGAWLRVGLPEQNEDVDVTWTNGP